MIDGDVQAAKRLACGSNRLIVPACFRDVTNDGKRPAALIFNFVDR